MNLGMGGGPIVPRMASPNIGRQMPHGPVLTKVTPHGQSLDWQTAMGLFSQMQDQQGAGQNPEQQQMMQAPGLLMPSTQMQPYQYRKGGMLPGLFGGY